MELTSAEAARLHRFRDAQPSAVVFDVDGTLYDQRRMRLAMAVRLARFALGAPRAGVRAVKILRAYRAAQEELRLACESDAGEQAARAAALAGCSVHEVNELVGRWMEREPLPILSRCARPGLREFLVRARAAGIALVVLSDYPAETKLVALGVRQYFDLVVSAQDAEVKRFKPHPAGLLAVLRRLGVPSNECLYVGDRPEVDALAARRARVPCALFSWPASADASWVGLRRFADLDRIVFAASA